MPNTQKVVDTNEADLEGLLADMGFGSDEVIEPVESVVGEFDLEKAAVNKLENAEALEGHYNAESDGEVTDAVPPTPAAEKKAKGKKEKKAKPAAEKKAPVERKHYASKAERVTDKFGADLGSNMVLTLTDAALEGEALAAKQKETLDLLQNGKEGVGVKVQNRITLLLEFVGGKSTKLNEVIERAFRILKKDGFIKSGEKGNLHVDLVTKYSPASARAMGNNTIAAMRNLKVIEKGADGNYVANPDSLVLMRVNSMLGL